MLSIFIVYNTSSSIFHDNDFEVFIDPNGDNHNYYELEINALNTRWELRLGRPYRDNGPVLDPDNMDGVQSAIQLDGTLNHPFDTDVGWTVELAFPWKGFASYGAQHLPPKSGEQWRVNFSRVEWELLIEDSVYRKNPNKPENNWVWSPQGAVAMHMPERWGFLQFSDSKSEAVDFRPDPTLRQRDLLMEIYYMQKAWYRITGSFAESLSDLGLSSDHDNVKINLIALQDGFTATAIQAATTGSGMQMFVNERGRLWSAAK